MNRGVFVSQVYESLVLLDGLAKLSALVPQVGVGHNVTRSLGHDDTRQNCKAAEPRQQSEAELP